MARYQSSYAIFEKKRVFSSLLVLDTREFAIFANII